MKITKTQKWIFAVAIVLIVGGASAYVITKRPTPENALATCQSLIKARLAHPSTAEFPGFAGHAKDTSDRNVLMVVQEKEPGVFMVQSYFNYLNLHHQTYNRYGGEAGYAQQWDRKWYNCDATYKNGKWEAKIRLSLF